MSGITVRFPDGERALIVSPREALIIAARGCVEGVLYKGKLAYLRLKVSIRAVLRLLLPAPALTSGRVTKRKQSPGGKRWVERLDRADSGLTASHRRVVSPLDHVHRRYAIGKRIGPIEQTA